MPKVQGVQTRAGYVETIEGAFQQITSLAAATGITAPAGATLAMIQAETQNVRWRDDGTDPTASVGMIIAAGDILMYTGDFSEIKLIEVTGSAKLNITYYR